MEATLNVAGQEQENVSQHLNFITTLCLCVCVYIITVEKPTRFKAEEKLNISANEHDLRTLSTKTDVLTLVCFSSLCWL